MRFILLDHDRLTVANICRHLAGLSHVGRFKTKVIRDQILDKNPYASVTTHETKVTWSNMEDLREIVRQADLVICATDSRGSRAVINKACTDENRTLIMAGAFRRAFGGQVLRIRPRLSPCYQCFLEALPEESRNQEISSSTSSAEIAYSDQPVPVEPGLSTDIAPISMLVVKLAIQELLQGKATTLRSLDEDLTAPWYLWLNRREAETDFAQLKPLGCEIDGMHVLRWYGVAIDRNDACPTCGDPSLLAIRQLGDALPIDDALAFTHPSFRE